MATTDEFRPSEQELDEIARLGGPAVQADQLVYARQREWCAGIWLWSHRKPELKRLIREEIERAVRVGRAHPRAGGEGAS